MGEERVSQKIFLPGFVTRIVLQASQAVHEDLKIGIFMSRDARKNENEPLQRVHA